MSEAKPQDGSTVKGYRTLSYGEIGKMNQFKDLSRQFIALLQQHGIDMGTDPSIQNTPECWTLMSGCVKHIRICSVHVWPRAVL